MIEAKLASVKKHLEENKVKIMIIGLGSVGAYLLDYFLSTADEQIEIVVAGRNREKMERDVNIIRISALIRRENRTNVTIEDGVDLENIDSIAACLAKHRPDFVINTSRVYSGLKYGSISWSNVRAYGIWIPLSIKYIRNIMLAYEKAGSEAIVINTSYSDGTIPWLKSAGIAYPDFGSGNLNHLLPRIRFAAARICDIPDFWNIDVAMATAHFHDVVISKEGHNEGLEQLLRVQYQGKTLPISQDELLSMCKITMPVDAKRNMMNASSNFDIVESILRAIRHNGREVFYSPGAFGEIGGYPVAVEASGAPTAMIDESCFAMDEMREKNRASIALDGIENIVEGCMSYTDALIEKTKAAFGVTLPKTVAFNEIDKTAAFIIQNIIEPALQK